ncbi:MAG: DUF111 family protein, partial [Acidobacteriota bacterium]
MITERTGFGAGSYEDARTANVVRGLLGTLEAGALSRVLSVLQCAIDDMLPQDVPVLLERMIEAGARDAFVQSVLMKKGRPGFLLTVLTDPEHEDSLSRDLLEHSSTLGVRMHRQARAEWDRDVVSVDTPWGAVRVKRALDRRGRPVRRQPEFEDCRHAAARGGV